MKFFGPLLIVTGLPIAACLALARAGHGAPWTSHRPRRPSARRPRPPPRRRATLVENGPVHTEALVNPCDRWSSGTTPATMDMPLPHRPRGNRCIAATRRSRNQARDALLDEAIAAFRAQVAGQGAPSLVRVRLELARAFFLKGEDTPRQAGISSGCWRASRRRRWRSTSTASSRIMRARKRWSLRLGVAARAGQQYRCQPGRTSRMILLEYPDRTASIYLSQRRQRARIRRRHRGLGLRRIPVPAGGRAGGCARAPYISRAASTAPTSSTGCSWPPISARAG